MRTSYRQTWLLYCYRLVPILLNGMKYSDLDILMLGVSLMALYGEISLNSIDMTLLSFLCR